MAAFKSEVKAAGALTPGTGSPLQYVFSSVTSAYISPIDGRTYKNSEYVLPFSWARLQSPTFRYSDGTKLYDSLVDWAKRGSKMFFFDQHGIFHWEDSAAIEMTKSLNSSMTPMWKYRMSTSHGGEGSSQLVFNVVSKESSVMDIYNNIHIVSSTPNGERIEGGEVNWASIEDPKSAGFIGYMKIMAQIESLFGSQNAVDKAVKYYKTFWLAPLVYSFETSGQPVRIFDICSLNGINLVVTSVSSTIDPKENKWWQQIQGEYFQKQGETVKTP